MMKRSDSRKAGSAAVEQHQRPDGESHDAAAGQDAVRGREDIDDEQHDGQTDQRQPRAIDRQDAGQIEREDQGDHPDHAWQDGAGIAQFADQAVDGHEHQDEHNLGSPERLEDALAQGHRDRSHRCLRDRQGPVADAASVELAQQIGQVCGDQVDHPEFQRLLRW